MKKILSILFTVILLISILAIPTHVSAAIKPNAVENAVQWAIDTANDDTHGYSQAYDRRWGTPDYDCASFVISAYRSVGFKLTYAAHCSNIKEEFMKEGFIWIPNTEIDLSTSKYLKPGDVLLRIAGHTEIYIGDNKQCGAHDDYDGNVRGDTYGNEVCAYTYSNRSNWSGILRYPVEKPIDIGTNFYANIKSNYSSKNLTNDNRNVSVRTQTEDANQVWYFERQSDNSYKITNCADNNALDVTGKGTTAGTNVGVYTSNNSDAQRWYIYGKAGAYRLKPKCNALALDAGAGKTDGSNVRMWTDNGATSQKFTITKLNKAASTYVECRAGTSLEPTSIWWNMTLYTNSYDLKIYSGTIADGELFAEIDGLTETYYSATLPAGEYEAYVNTCNSFSSTKSINTIKFTVEEGIALGDVDRDKVITVLDATEIQKHCALLTVLDEAQLKLSDTDKDNVVTVLDATQIQKYLAKIIEEL